MMQIVPIQALARQQFTITFDKLQFDITLTNINGCTYATILRAGVPIVAAALCVSGFQIMPSRYMEGTTGNFAFDTPNDENPYFENFGITHFLLYATADELAAARAGNAIV
jgi:hypothetical protein